MSDARSRSQLQKFPKDVIIESFIRVAFFRLDDVILEQAPWTAMLIGTNSYTLFQFRGSILLNCNEVPLAIRSFSAEEAYEAIVSSSSQFLDTYPSQKLFIISRCREPDAACDSMDFFVRLKEHHLGELYSGKT